MGILRLFSTKHHSNWWKNRDIDWDADYLSTWRHPHRWYIANKLMQFRWGSLFEFGCGAGANLFFLAQTFPNSALGGIDIAPKAIEVAQKALPRGVFRVGDGDPLVVSDSSFDVLLSDMALIYVGPFKIRRYLSEFRRSARQRIVLSEFYHPSFWKRVQMTLAGRYTHNYPKLLEKLGCYDIMVEKMPKELWPGAKDGEYRYFISARI